MPAIRYTSTPHSHHSILEQIRLFLTLYSRRRFSLRPFSKQPCAVSSYSAAPWIRIAAPLKNQEGSRTHSFSEFTQSWAKTAAGPGVGKSTGPLDKDLQECLMPFLSNSFSIAQGIVIKSGKENSIILYYHEFLPTLQYFLLTTASTRSFKLWSWDQLVCFQLFFQAFLLWNMELRLSEMEKKVIQKNSLKKGLLKMKAQLLMSKFSPWYNLNQTEFLYLRHWDLGHKSVECR